MRALKQRAQILAVLVTYSPLSDISKIRYCRAKSRQFKHRRRLINESMSYVIFVGLRFRIFSTKQGDILWEYSLPAL